MAAARKARQTVRRKSFGRPYGCCWMTTEKNVAMWLGQVAGEDPAKALDLIAKLAEFAAPKLARTEVVGDGGGALIHKGRVRDCRPCG